MEAKWSIRFLYMQHFYKQRKALTKIDKNFKKNLSNTVRLNIWQTCPKTSLSLSLRLYDWYNENENNNGKIDQINKKYIDQDNYRDKYRK